MLQLLAQAADAAPAPAETAALSMLQQAWFSPLVWAMLLGAFGVWLLLPGAALRGKSAALLLAGLALLAFVVMISPLVQSLRSSMEPLVLATVGAGALGVLLAGSFLRTNNPKFGVAWLVLMIGACTGIGYFTKTEAICPCFPLSAIVLAVLAVVLLLSPLGSRSTRPAGCVLALAGLAMLAYEVAPKELDATGGWLFFWLLAGLAILSAVSAISMQSPVYSAIWFGVSLLSTAGLFLLQGAQFLSVATVAVYAGAILVTFLFVLMLAQPEGHAYYDRMSWGEFPTVAAVLAAALIVGGLTYRYTQLESQPIAVAPRPAAATLDDGVLHTDHMAKLGGYMFSRHMLSLEAAGSLLLAALVGAVAILIKGREEQVAAARPAAPPAGGSE